MVVKLVLGNGQTAVVHTVWSKRKWARVRPQNMFLSSFPQFIETWKFKKLACLWSKRSSDLKKILHRDFKIKVNDLFKTSTEIQSESTIDQTIFRSQTCMCLKLPSFRTLKTWALLVMARTPCFRPILNDQCANCTHAVQGSSAARY